MNLITEYPVWFIPVCIIAGIFYSALLYYRNSKNNFKKTVTIILSVLRAITTSLIVFLLLSPVFRVKSFVNEKPIIIFAQDNSNSILLNKDSVFYKTIYKNKVNELLDELSSDFEIKRFDFSERVNENNSFNFNGKQTDISSIFYETENRFINRNVGAIILSSDGIYNSGSNPLYLKSQINAPIFCIAMGDTSIRKDIFIQKVNYNKITYLGNKFPLEITVNANKCDGNNVKLSVFHNNKEAFSQNITIKGEQYSVNIPVTLDANESGLQRYTIRVSPIDNEVTEVNNIKEIFIEVLDSRRKILILYDAPHPDISAIKQTLERNKNYQVETYDIEAFTKNVNEFNLLIFHSLPSNNLNFNRIFSEIKKNNIPVLYIVGSQTNINQFNQLQTGINIISKGNSLNECYPSFSDDFSFFTINEFNKKIASTLPPMHCLYGNYQISPSIETLIYQKIGNVISNFPLIAYSQNIETRNAFILGEGIWRWRMINFSQKDNTDFFDELIIKTVQFLSAKNDKSQFRVNNSYLFYENQNIEFNAELYNDNYELINYPDVDLIIKNSKGKNYDYKFSKQGNSYYLDAGLLPVDNYTYNATVLIKNKKMNFKGSFTVAPVDIEFTDLIANHQLLYNLSQKSSGELIYPKDIDKLKEILTERKDIKTVKYERIQYLEWTNIIWILIIIILFISTEWFIRKYNGGY